VKNRHGGAPRGERPASWDARRLARRLAYHVTIRPRVPRTHPNVSRRSAHPSIRVSEAKCKPRAQKRAAGTKRCCHERSEETNPCRRKTCRGGAAAPCASPARSPRAALLMAHVRRQNLPAQGKLRRRVDQCGARVAPQGWAWLHQVIKAMREGKSQSAAVEAANFAALGYRERVTISWPNCPFWEPLEFFMRNDGTMIRTDMAPAQPDIEAQFIELAASPWLLAALNADTRT